MNFKMLGHFQFQGAGLIPGAGVMPLHVSWHNWQNWSGHYNSINMTCIHPKLKCQPNRASLTNKTVNFAIKMAETV